MRRKLEARGYPPEDIDPVLERLRSERLQSDERYAEALLRQRVERGYGPLRIAAELREAGVAEELAQACLEHCAEDWRERLRALRLRKFGAQPPRDYAEQAKQSRFLHSRGFSAEDIRRLFRETE